MTNLDLIKRKEAMIPASLKSSINGSVNTISRNYGAIAGFKRSNPFFNREANGRSDQRTTMQKAFVFVAAVALNSPIRQEAISAELASWMPVIAANGNPEAAIDFYVERDNASLLMNAAERAWGDFDIPLAKEKLTRARSAISTMIRLCDQMPEFKD